MKKTILATSILLTLGVVAPSANAAFTPLSAGAYTMNITSGCYEYGNCQESGNGAYTDNTAAQASYTSTAQTVTTRPVGSTIGSGIAGDGLMGVIDFSVDASGDMTISSFNQDSNLFTVGGTFYFDALGSGGTSAMTGNIGAGGAMSFTPTGREAMYGAFATDIGVQEWNRDALSNVFDTFTTGTSTNRDKGSSPAFSMTGTALADDGLGGWTGTLVSAGNINGNNFTGLSEVQYSELWDISVTAAPAVPIPAAAWLFGSGLLGLIGVARRKNRRY